MQNILRAPPRNPGEVSHNFFRGILVSPPPSILANGSTPRLLLYLDRAAPTKVRQDSFFYKQRALVQDEMKRKIGAYSSTLSLPPKDLRGIVRRSGDAIPESQDLDDFCWSKPSWCREMEAGAHQY